MIETPRLVLIPATVQSLRAEAARDLPRFASLLSVGAPADWPPELYDDDAVASSLRELQENPDRAPWNTYYFVLKQGRVLIGAGGFMAGPDRRGRVELGYSVLQAHRRQGYASEAVNGMADCAFADKRVRAIVAHTYPDLIASIGVLEKTGFRLMGSGEESGTVRFERAR